jgi:D-alanyl-lipoteichoic acid acyltransferase DltB (MBOAT superfamily)
MQFPTLIFAVFFVITLSISWLIRSNRTLQKLFLLLASYVFYAYIDKRIVLVLAGASLLNFICGERIAALVKQNQSPRAWLLGGVIVNVAVLGVFKYYNFFREGLAGLADLLGLSLHLPILELWAPVGLSFYTFTGIAYLVDLSRGRGIKANTWLDFFLFNGFFPKLLAGPICRSHELLPQIHAPAPAGVPDLSRVAALILSGLVKKVVLGTLVDTHLVSAIFDTPENFSSPALWVGMLGYALLLYWDFSGYTDLARGLALLLGFNLPENFNHPYVSTDISDFWRRWHMSLSFWLRDYLFMPLGGLHVKKRWSALVLSMTIAGLWHGANWTYVAWGFYHGLLLVFHHGLRFYKLKWDGGWLGRAGTFLLVSFGWVLFRSPDFPSAFAYLNRMVHFGAAGEGFELLVLLLIVLGLVLQVCGGQLREGYIRFTERMPFWLRPVTWFATGMLILAFKPSGIAPYIYFGF